MIITIAGNNGAGKSTAAKLLATRLGYEYFYMGDEFRRQAQEHGMTIGEFDEYVKSHPAIDKQMDGTVYPRLAQQDNVVVDSRTGWHFLPEAFSVFITAPLDIRALRIANKPRKSEVALSADEVKKDLVAREEALDKRMKELYGIAVYNPENFDLVIDSESLSPEQIVERIISAAQL